MPTRCVRRSPLPLALVLTAIAALASAEPARASGGADELTQRDLVSILVLWVHGITAVGWIIGVVVMALALSARPGVFAEDLRLRVRGAYLDWGAWVLWSLVLWVVLTGVYNLLVVTPFPLAWRPSDLRALDEVPFGVLYETILAVKLGLFAGLLVSGTLLLRRALRAGPDSPGRDVAAAGFVRTLGSALGPAGVIYVALVPLTIFAAVALRYVHVLSHVGAATGS